MKGIFAALKEDYAEKNNGFPEGKLFVRFFKEKLQGNNTKF